MKHGDQSPPYRSLQFCPVSCDLDLSIGVPRVPETSHFVEREMTG